VRLAETLALSFVDASSLTTESALALESWLLFWLSLRCHIHLGGLRHELVELRL
jgi:hypothetical protein